MTTTAKYIANDRPTRETDYNGWTNYETWVTKLWMDNDEGSYRFWQEQTREIWDNSQNEDDPSMEARYSLAALLESGHDDNTPEAIETSVYADLLNSALKSVNWHEIANSLLDDVVNAS